ncbi:NADPH:quinone reductase-like Zn-dependent oxidoreductase [Neorhizobium galegae]|uniref:zinc-binding dehydrogenase n=1 Tax=Neorhizobium galegae TaxID=399 RepID=UPI001AEB18BB|nr:zinc-binding dehydrogenase [Neorhizobium galegae]MBP2550022.1 NADPH:quinone reductase-like Zn-dependent oxidoreductase [Neorhizobium galegae]
MHSLSYSRFGKPAEVLQVSDQPQPEPGAGEVRLSMRLSPIHNHDLLTISGQYGYKPELPALSGSEGMGVVDALGEGVEGLAVGQRVAASGLKGAWSNFAIARAASVVPLPDAISDEVGAQLIAMPLSALTLLEFTGIAEGQWLIQNAANGAVAKVVSQLARPRGIHVINLVRRQDAVAELTELGIDNVVATSNDGWKDRVREITAGQPIAVGVDGVGGTASGDLLSLLGEGGQLISFGVMSGQPMQISSGDVIFKQAVVKGFWLAKLMTTMEPERMRRLVSELVTRAASGEMRLQTDGIYTMKDAAAAMTAAAESGRKGKVLLSLQD